MTILFIFVSLFLISVVFPINQTHCFVVLLLLTKISIVKDNAILFKRKLHRNKKS